MKLTVTCDNVQGKISGGLSSVVKRTIWNECRYRVMPESQARRINRSWDGTKKLFHRGRKAFPIGLLCRVTAVLDKSGVPYDVVWEKTKNDHPQIPELKMRPAGREQYGLHSFQVDALIEALTNPRSVIQIATGGGKTVVAGHIISRVRKPTLFMVHTKDLLYQAKDLFITMFGEENVGQIGDNIVDPQNITVATIQTVANSLNIKYLHSEYEDVRWNDKIDTRAYHRVRRVVARTNLTFMDECHRVAAPTTSEVMHAIPSYWKFGLSASPWRDDGADLEIEGAFGPKCYMISASELYRLGHLVKPHITFHVVPPLPFPKGSYYEIYDKYIVENDHRNRAAVNWVKSNVERGISTMILIRYIKHGHVIKKMLDEALGMDVPFLSGRDKSDIRKDVLDNMRRGRLRCLVASTIADEGLDIPSLEAVVLLGGGKSSVKALQRIGRTLRTHNGKKQAYVLDFEDNAKYLVHHSARRRKMYQTEDEWTIE